MAGFAVPVNLPASSGTGRRAAQGLGATSAPGYSVIGLDPFTLRGVPGVIIKKAIYALWREEALRRGYASSIALPLQEKGKVMGALNIYATEPDAFDPDEVKLLEELAFDLAYGIAALRTLAEHDRMEKALREAEKKYHSIFENAVEGIFQSNPEGRLISVNSALAKMHGYGSPEEMISSIMDLGHQVFVDHNCRDEFKREMEKLGVIRGAEYQVYRKDSSKIWVSVNARAVRDEHGAIQYYEGFIQEVMDRKRKKA